MNTSIQKGPDDYRVITITHKTTSINRLKEYFVDSDDDNPGDFPARRLTELKESFRMKELLYLNTCNRVTFFFTSDEHVDDAYLTRLFQFINPALRDELVEKHIAVSSVFEGKDAMDHWFSVSASLDSMIIGEREIMGQIKEAYQKSKEAGLCADSIRLAVERAIVFSKKIYSETRIGEKPVSVVSLAFRQVLEHMPHHDAGIVMIGAGQTNQQLANFIRKYGYTNVHIFNRSLEKAEALAEKVGGKAYPLSDLAKFKQPFQVVLSCTSSPVHILTLNTFRLMVGEGDHHYTMLDLAVPGDIDPAILEHYSVNFFDINALRDEARKNMEFRQQEVVRAKEILETFQEDFEQVYRQRQLELALHEIPEEVKALRQKALHEVFGKDVEGLDEQARKVLDDVVQYMEKKYIGIPMKIAKKTILGLDNFKD